jgi:acetylglutamate kinase
LRIVVKIGGAALDNKELAHKCARAIVDLVDGNHHQVAVVHGGGVELTRTLLCGADGLTFRARKKANDGFDLGFVGEICSADPRWIDAIWNAGGIPVISSLALGTDGQYYNVNADQTAAACAVACHAHALIFLTDVEGVKSADGSVIRWLHNHQIDDLVKTSVVGGGMLPKLEACREALRRGVGRVRILPAKEVDLLPDFYTCKIDCGTEVMVA